MIDNYFITTGYPTQWETADTLDEATKIRETYLEDHPHEEVFILETIHI